MFEENVTNNSYTPQSNISDNAPADPEKTGELLSVREVSKMTGYHRDYVTALVRKGKLTASKIGNSYVINKASVHKLLSGEDLPVIVDEKQAGFLDLDEKLEALKQDISARQGLSEKFAETLQTPLQAPETKTLSEFPTSTIPLNTQSGVLESVKNPGLDSSLSSNGLNLDKIYTSFQHRFDMAKYLVFGMAVLAIAVGAGVLYNHSFVQQQVATLQNNQQRFAVGPKGDKGDPGEPGTPSISSGNNQITYVPGTKIIYLQGKPGPAGPQGVPGAPGDQGPAGPAGATGSTSPNYTPGGVFYPVYPPQGSQPSGITVVAAHDLSSVNLDTTNANITNLNSTGSANFKDINLTGNLVQSGTGIISTGTGAISLNGPVAFNNAVTNLTATNPIIDLTSPSTLGINTTTNRPVTFGSGLVTIPNLAVTASQANSGTFTLDSNVTTGTVFSISGNSLTSGILFANNFTANAGNGQITKGGQINVIDATTGGGGYSTLSINVSGSGVGSGNKYLLDLNPGANTEVVFDAMGAFRPTTSFASNTNTIGSPSFYWKNGYFDQITANNIAGVVVSGATSSTTWTIGSTQVGDVNEAIIFQRNSGSGNATLQWNAGANDLRYLGVNYPFNSTYTVSDASIGTNVNLYSGTLTNNTTSGTQKLLSLTNTGTGTTENGIYLNNTGTGTTAFEIAGNWSTGILTNNNSINVGTGNLTTGTAAIGTATPAATALLELSSTTKGFLGPRMTTGQRDLISSPSTGLLIYNTSTNKYNVYNGTTWKSVGSTEIGGDVESGTAGSLLFVGTGPVLSQSNSQLFWDNTNNILGIGLVRSGAISATNAKVVIQGSGTTSSTSVFNVTDSSGNSKLFVRDDGNIGMGTTTPNQPLEVQRDQNAATRIFVTNNTSGTLARASLDVNNASGGVSLSAQSAGFTTAGSFVATSGNLTASAGLTGGLYINADASSAPIIFSNNNGTERFRLAGSGNVGIGTVNPALPLEVAGTQAAPANSGTTATGRLRLNGSDHIAMDFGAINSGVFPAWIQVHDSGNQATNYPLVFQPNGGSVGIGTVSPQGAASRFLAVSGGSGNNDAGVSLTNAAPTGTGTIGQINFYSGTTNVSNILSKRDGADDAANLIFQTKATGGSLTTQMQITSTGDVGIGTGATGPLYRLHVAGSGATINIQDTASQAIDVGGTLSLSGNAPNASTFASIHGGKENVTANDFASYLNFSTRVNGGALTERLRISSSGDVGVGAGAPLAKFSVVGGVVAIKSNAAESTFLRLQTNVTGNLTGLDGAAIYQTNDTFNALTGNYGALVLQSRSTADRPIIFVTGSTPAERLRIDGTGNVGIGTTAPASKLHVASAPTASANFGLVSLGSGPFDGSTSGFFTGSSNGTVLAGNAATGFSGNLLDMQIAGNSKFLINSFGDQTTNLTTLDGSTTANGSGTASATLILTSGTNFDVGNYVKVSSTDCVTGVNICYAKITAKSTNTLTISPAITWANGSTVAEVHVPEIGGTNLTQTLANRYGRGYFVDGIVTGNGSTSYSDQAILSTTEKLGVGTATPGYTLDLRTSATAATLNLESGSVTYATGGTVTDVGAYRIHTFTSSGTFQALSNLSVDVLVIAGGGGGGGSWAGGGGGGGFVEQSGRTANTGSYTVTVGAGGAGGGANGSIGQDSVFDTITAKGGGGGGDYLTGHNGSAGGSGGGGGYATNTGGAATQGNSGGGTGYGNAGGNGGSVNSSYAGAGGGGAGSAAASNPNTGSGGVENQGTAGGSGRASSISGSSVTYAGGGGGGGSAGGGAGGSGGGGAGTGGGSSCGASAPSGTANTGGGGGGYGGNATYTCPGGNGGSGIVIVRYLLPTTKKLRVDTSGNVAIGTLAGATSNTLCYNTSAIAGMNTFSTCSSSRRYKENITDLQVDKEKLFELQPVYFKWKDRDEYEPGLIAEDVAAVIPDLAFSYNGRIEGVRYAQLPVYLLQVIKDMDKEVVKHNPAGDVELTGGLNVLSGIRGATLTVTDKVVSASVETQNIIVSGNIDTNTLHVAATAFVGSLSVGKSGYAERFASSSSLLSGMLVSADLNNTGMVSASSAGYDSALTGVVAPDSGIILGPNNASDTTYPIALSGRTAVLVTDENGPVHAGDYLTSSNIMPGYAMKSVHSGTVIGQAFEGFDGSNGATQSINGHTIHTGSVSILVRVGYQSVANTIVLGDDVTAADQGSSADGLTSSNDSLTYIINRGTSADAIASADILQIQNQGVTRLMVAASGATTINAQVSGDKVLTVRNNGAELFSINSSGTAVLSANLIVKKDLTVLGSVLGSTSVLARNDSGATLHQGDIVMLSPDGATGTPVIGNNPVLSVVKADGSVANAAVVGVVDRNLSDFNIPGGPAQGGGDQTIIATGEYMNVVVTGTFKVLNVDGAVAVGDKLTLGSDGRARKLLSTENLPLVGIALDSSSSHVRVFLTISNSTAAVAGASTPPPDDSTPPDDSGTPPDDSGAPPDDSGTPPPDSGTPPADPGV